MQVDKPVEKASQDVTAPASRSRRTLVAGSATVLVVLVVLVSVIVTTASTTPKFIETPSPEQGLRPVSGAAEDPLPLRTLPAFGDGEAVDLTRYLGEPLVVNFWATWCVPCIREMPMLRDTSEKLAGHVTFLGINVQDSPSKAEAFLAELEVDYDQAADPEGAYFRASGGFGMPTTLLVDADGTVRYRHTGELDADSLRGLIEDHLGVF